MRIKPISLLLSLCVVFTSLNSTVYAEVTRQDSLTQRFDTIFTVLEESVDTSDYSETFRQSFFNFQTNYSANNCNYAQRMEILKKKDRILDNLIDNVSILTVEDVRLQMNAFKLLDLELTILRNLDVLEQVPVNQEEYTRFPIYTIIEKKHKQDFSNNEELQAEINLILSKYEQYFNKKTTKPDGSIEITGTYSECANRFNRTYQAWTETLEKFEKGNSQQVTALNKALKEFIKSLSEFGENFNKNLNKVFKEELAFINKNTQKDDGFFKNIWNLTKGSAQAMGSDLVKVAKSFKKEYNKLKVNAGSSPQELKRFLIGQRTVDSSQNAFEQALRSGLNLNEIAQSVESLKQQAEASIDIQSQIKKLQMLTDVHSSYALEIQATTDIPVNYFQDCIQTIKGRSGEKSLDKIFEHVYTNQCK